MKKLIYLKLQLKKAFKAYPAILIITIITLASIAVTCGIMAAKLINGETNTKISLGIVGNVEDNYLSTGLYALENVDSVRFTFDFTKMTREEAILALNNRKISGYVDIPDGFAESIYNGENKPLKYVTRNEPASFGSTLTGEFTKFISGMVIETQSAIYSMQCIAEDLGLSRKTYKQIDRFSYTFLEFILNRGDLYDIKELRNDDTISLGGYYVCGMLLFFMLIWGISCNKILSSKNYALSRSLNSFGLKTTKQILCEYSAYFAVTFFTIMLLALCAGVILSCVDTGIRELENAGITACITFILKILPPIIMITVMQFAFYEFVSNTVAAVLIQFMTAIGLGYVSGCFYPSYFFPEAVQKVAAVLPTGAAFSYIKNVMTYEPISSDCILILLYTAFFALLAAAARKHKLQVD